MHAFAVNHAKGWPARLFALVYGAGFWRFLTVGCVMMPPALVLAVGARLMLN